MSRFHEALKRAQPLAEQTRTGEPAAAPSRTQKLVELGSLVRNPAVVRTPSAAVSSTIARAEGVRRISETVAASANVAGDTRVFVAGCAPGDGTSTVAAALVLDLTQRHHLRTLLVDANPRRSKILPIFGAAEPEAGPADGYDDLRVRSTLWSRLQIGTFKPLLPSATNTRVLTELSDRISAFPAAIVDLGAVCLDSRGLPLLRKHDAVLLVVRAGFTRRNELAAAANIFLNLDHAVSGVVLNGFVSAIPPWIRRLLPKGV
jgi:Mrp family chromosome partitioning ATPase